VAPRTGLLTCAFPNRLPSSPWKGASGIWPDSFSSTLNDSTGRASSALTVAGQWRIFTAFPNILVSLRDELRAPPFTKCTECLLSNDNLKIGSLFCWFSDNYRSLRTE